MMKKLALLGAFSVVFGVVPAFPQASGFESPIKKACNMNSVTGRLLCPGLIGYYDFSEPTDSTRRNSAGYGSDLRECDGTNVTKLPWTPFVGAGGSVATTTSTYYPLYIPYASGAFGSGFWTISFYLLTGAVTGAGTDIDIISTLDPNSQTGLRVYLHSTAANTWHVRAEMYENFTGTLRQMENTTNIGVVTGTSATDRTLVIVSSSPITAQGGSAQLRVSVTTSGAGSTGAYQNTAYTYNPRANGGWNLMLISNPGATCGGNTVSTGTLQVGGLMIWNKPLLTAYEGEILRTNTLYYPF